MSFPLVCLYQSVEVNGFFSYLQIINASAGVIMAVDIHPHILSTLGSIDDVADQWNKEIQSSDRSQFIHYTGKLIKMGPRSVVPFLTLSIPIPTPKSVEIGIGSSFSWHSCRTAQVFVQLPCHLHRHPTR